MTLKEKRCINENKSTNMDQDEICIKRFLFCAFTKLTTRRRNVEGIGVDRDAFASDVNKFLLMTPAQLSLYEAGTNVTDLEKKAELMIKKIFEKYNL
jgi:hypothetical protein